MANPGASAYAFGIDRTVGRGGQFFVSYRTSSKDEVQTWVSLLRS